MKRTFSFVSATFVLIFSLTLRAQTPQIELLVFQDLSTIDFAAFAFTNNLNGAPRIFQVVISPEGKNVVVQGKIDWKRDETTDFVELVNFKTEPFKARSFFNDELGSLDIKISDVEGNKELAKENVNRGKPTGVYGITLQLFDDSGNYLSDTFKELSFLNPSQTLTILLPQEGSYYDIGNVQAQWIPLQGATSYKIRANVLLEGSTNLEDALNGSNPIINNKDVGTANVVNLSTILDRQWVGGQRIVLAVTAFVAGPGGGTQLRSALLTFRLNQSGVNSNVTVDPDLIRLATFLTGQVNQDFINKLTSGQITAEQIQITDENNQVIGFPDFLKILTFLESHKESIISINFQAK